MPLMGRPLLLVLFPLKEASGVSFLSEMMEFDDVFTQADSASVHCPKELGEKQTEIYSNKLCILFLISYFYFLFLVSVSFSCFFVSCFYLSLII